MIHMALREATSTLDMRSIRDRRPLWVGGGVLIVALVLYLSTLLTHVPLNADKNLVDVGEIQIALNLWGTLHHTGYPLYTILGSAFTTLYKGLGANPAAGPSVFSVLWAVGALCLIYALYLELSRHAVASCSSKSPSSGASSACGTSTWPHDAAAGIAALYIGATSAFWINASIAEVYSMYMALTLAALLLARRLASRWSDRGFIWLAVLLGLAGAHYRLAAFVLPAVAIYVVPNLWRRGRRARWLLPVAALAGLASFLPYVYLPLRAGQGAQWVFGDPDTWDGFWRVFIGPGSVIGGPRSVSAAVSGPLRVMRTLLAEAHPLGVIGGLSGLVVMLFRNGRRQEGFALLSLIPAYVGAAVLFPIAAVAENFLMVVTVALGAGIVAILAWLVGRGRIWGVAGLVAAAALVPCLAMRTYATVDAITRTGGGRDLVALVDRTPRDAGHGEPAFMLPWGRNYFAAYFARYVSHEIDGLAVVDHNTDFVADLAVGRRLYTLPLTFHAFPLDWWERRLGQAYLSAAAPEVVQISDQPVVRMEDVPRQPPVALGDGIELLGATAEREGEGQALVFTLYFQAAEAVAVDYSVSVRISDTDAIVSAGDILAQQDSAHPVFGWYPTSRWRPGEIVRDIYVVPMPDGAQPRRAEVLLYERLPSGEFRSLQPAAIELPPVQET